MSKSAKLMPEANNVPMCVNYMDSAFHRRIPDISVPAFRLSQFSEGPPMAVQDARDRHLFIRFENETIMKVR